MAALGDNQELQFKFTISAVKTTYSGLQFVPQAFNEAVYSGFGGGRNDQKMDGSIEPGNLRVLLHCFTEGRFLEVLEDFKCERTKERLNREFLRIGIVTDGLVVDIENIEEVEGKAAAIKRKQEREKTFMSMSPASEQDEIPMIIVQGGAYSRLTWKDIEENDYMEKVKTSAKEGYKVLLRGGTAVDAVEAAVRVMEDSEIFDGGHGSLLNCKGNVECDAMIMDGNTLKNGALVSGRHFPNPVSAAKLIMNKTYHSALNGEGARKFVDKENNRNLVKTCEPQELITERAKKLQIPHLYYCQFADSRFKGKPVMVTETEPDAPEIGGGDTVSAVARDANGHLACAMSAGGVPGRLEGRVSDAPMIGCGGYANKDGAATTSGLGESLIKLTLAREVVYKMEGGENAQDSADYAVEKMENELNDVCGIIGIDKDGNFGKAFSTTMMGWASIKEVPGQSGCHALLSGLKQKEEMEEHIKYDPLKKSFTNAEA